MGLSKWKCYDKERLAFQNCFIMNNDIYKMAFKILIGHICVQHINNCISSQLILLQ